MSTTGVSSKLTYPSKYVEVFGSKMHFIEAGEGDPILLLHGIPTSCYVWRNVIPHIATLGRCIAPDLIGMGHSDKPDIEYTIHDHIKYIEKFIETLNLKKIILIMHGWGSVVGLDYAMRHEKNCKGLVFYEAFLHTLSNMEEETSLALQEQVINLRDKETQRKFLENGANFINQIISSTVMRKLSKDELENYQQPFTKAGASKPILQYLNELPTAEGNTKIDKLIAEYTKKLVHSKLPKLMMYSVPGFITTMATVMWAKDNLPNIEIVDVGEEFHFAQESNPTLVGEAISAWLQGVEQM